MGMSVALLGGGCEEGFLEMSQVGAMEWIRLGWFISQQFRDSPILLKIGLKFGFL